MCFRSRAILVFLLLATLLSANTKKLQQELEDIISSYQSKALVGLHVISLNDTKPIFQKNQQELFYPGSALKLFVAASALEILGPQFTFKTELLSSGHLENSCLKGNLVIKGAGDPSLTFEDLERLILELKQKNIKEISGDLVVDCSEFDDITLGPGWIWEDKMQGKYTPVEALVLNQGLVDVWINPADIAMMAPSVQIHPVVPYITIENKAIMAKIDPLQKSLKVKKKLIKGKDVIVVEGAMSLTSRPLKFSIPVEHPADFAAAEFSLLLKKHGIKHEGKIVFNHFQGEHQVLATHSSCPLFDLLRMMLKTNNDLYANSFIKKIGRFRFGKPGTWPNGCQAVREFLMQVVSKDLKGAVIVDGSGESSFNKISSEMMALFLRHLQHKYVYAPELMACMPISGVDGCLKKKFKQKSFFSKLRGFSFMLKEDSCLCGYLITSGQESLVFCLMSKQFKPFQESCAHEIEERICETLLKYTKG